MVAQFEGLFFSYRTGSWLMKARASFLLFALLATFAGGCTTVQSSLGYQAWSKFAKEQYCGLVIRKYKAVIEQPADVLEAYIYSGNSHRALYRASEEGAGNRGSFNQVVEPNPKDANECKILAASYAKTGPDGQGKITPPGHDEQGRRRFEQAAATLEGCAEKKPSDPGGFQTVAAFYWAATHRNPALDDRKKEEYVDRGIAAVNKALALKADHFEAVVYKGLLYRVKATVSRDPAERMRYLEDAAKLLKQGRELKRLQEQGARERGVK